MKTTISTSLLAAGLFAATSMSAWAGGCNSGHVSAEAETPMVEQMATMADTDQVLTTGQISVAGIDCATTPDAAECAAPTTN